ncbi:MAG TPA: class I SAM-dependent methyltransferase [Vicinamibacteria bacterium]|nr:class I SAM-dependent methyltransferase [Vicinamibacteria bacterium]
MAEPGTEAAGPSTLVLRHAFQERLRARFRPGARVLNLGCGSGADALLLAGQGVSVLGFDLREAALHQARRRALAAGLASRARFELRAPHALRLEDGVFDGAFSGVGVLERADLPPLGRALAVALREDAPVVLSLPAPRPAAARYRARERDERLLGPGFAWSRGLGLGILVPGRARESWAARHPHVFAALAALESLVREWPVVRDLGDYLVLEGARR